jgi:hypothetical protein
MEPINSADTRPVLEIDVGQSQIAVPLSDADRDRLLIGIALRLGIINPNTVKHPLSDLTIDDEKRIEVMEAVYKQTFDTETGEWVPVPDEEKTS